MPVAIPFIALAVTAASAGFAVKSSLDQAKAAKKSANAQRRGQEAAREAERIQQVQANVEVRKDKQKQLREARLRKAQILQGNINAGAGLGTSTTVGALGGINSQFGANIGSINQRQGFSQQLGVQTQRQSSAQSDINKQQGKITQSQAQTGISNSIGGLANNIFDRSGGFTSIFGGNDQPTV